MNVFKTLAASLLLSTMLIGGAIASDKVNINTANAAELDRVLVNVGASKAQAIVTYRKDNGAFKSLEQLAMVKGIGLKTVEKNRDRIELGGSGGAARKTAAPAPAAAVRSKAAR